MNKTVTFIDKEGRILAVWSGPFTALYRNMPDGSLVVEGRPPAMSGWLFDIEHSDWVKEGIENDLV